jgi:hypothetical protein
MHGFLFDKSLVVVGLIKRKKEKLAFDLIEHVEIGK